MQMNARTRYTLSAAALLLLLAGVCGCPGRSADRQAGQGQPAAQGQPRADDAAEQSAPAKKHALPFPDGRPGSWPIAELSLPLGANIAEYDRPPVEGAPFGSVAKEWAMSFKYANTWDAAVQHLDSCLAPLGYERLVGGKNDITPLDPVEAGKQRMATVGQNSYISADRKVIVYLYYQGNPDLKSYKLLDYYRLQVLVFDTPQTVKAPSAVEPLQ